MALFPVDMPPFPDVPAQPGVPPMSRSLTFGAAEAALSAVATVLIDDGFGFGDTSGTVWGIYTEDGELAVTADSVIAFDFRKSRRVADFPIEEGGFASYNKVTTPFEPRITFVQGGSDEARSNLLSQLDELIDSLELYTVVTPEVTYDRVNVVDYNYVRSGTQGVELLRVEVQLQEIRIIEAGQFTKTQEATGEATQNGGTVSTVPVPETQGSQDVRERTSQSRVNSLDDVSRGVARKWAANPDANPRAHDGVGV